MKYRTEKALHEIIRDLPEAAKVDRNLERGMIIIEDALTEIARIIREERQRWQDRTEEKEPEA